MGINRRMMKSKNVFWTLALTFIGLPGFTGACSREAQVGSTSETKLMSEYSAATQEYDNIKPTVSEATIAGTITNDTTLSLTWNKASDDETGSLPTALTYRVYMSPKSNIESAEDAMGNGTALTEWTADQAETTLTIPKLKSMNNLYVNVVVKDEKGNATSYTMVSLKNDSPFGDLFLKGTKGTAELNESLQAHQTNTSMTYDAFLVTNSDLAFAFKIANADQSVSWNFDDLTIDSASSPVPSKDSNSLVKLDVTGSPKAYQILFDVTDKETPKLLVKPNRPLLESEFELQLKTSKVLTYTSQALLIQELQAALAAASTDITFSAGAKFEFNYEVYTDELTKCSLKNAGYTLKQKFKISSGNSYSGHTIRPTYTNALSAGASDNVFRNPNANAANKAFSISLKNRQEDRQKTFDNNTTIAGTAIVDSDKGDEFTKVTSTTSTKYERSSAQLSYFISPTGYGTCGSTSACTFSTVADVLAKFPNADLSSVSTDSLGNIAGTSLLYDAEYVLYLAGGVVLSDVLAKKVTLNILYEVIGGGTPTPIYAKIGLKLNSSLTSSVELSDNYKAGLSKMQGVVNAWAANSTWFEASDDQIDKTKFIYKHFNRCQ